MTEARGHHFISQCYLKRFTRNGSKNSKLWVFDRQTGESFSTVPANVAKQRDFNRIEGRPAGELENSLAGFEGKVDRALTVIEQSHSLEDFDAWVHVLNLATLFAVRNPRMRENMRGFQDALARRMLDLVLARPERWESQTRKAAEAGYIDPDHKVSYEQAKEFHERGEYTIEVANAAHIRTEFHVFDPVLRTMVDRKWTLFVASVGSGGFLTCDHPVCLMNSNGEPPSLMHPLGYGMTETTVLFPITRDLAAAGTFERGDKVVELKPDQVAEINASVLHYAERQVYAADNHVGFKMGPSEPIVRGADISRYASVRKGKKK